MIPVKFEQPIYTLNLPSSGKEVKYRPYLVKEEKLLLTALESDDFKMILEAIKAIINNCTFGEVKPQSLTTYDMEYLFLNLRGRSQGETLRLNIVSSNCPNKEDGGECDKPTEIVIKIEDIKCVKYNKDTDEFVPFERSDSRTTQLPLDETSGVVMRHPSFEDLTIGDKIFEVGKDPQAKILSGLDDLKLELMSKCLVQIYQGEEIYDASQYSTEEKVAWFGDLDKAKMDIIENYFDSIPKLRHACKFKCKHCDQEGDYIISGLRHFFALG